MSKKRNKKNVPSYSRGLAPTKERLQHNGGVTIEAISERHDGVTYTRRHRAKFNSPLDGYLWEGVLELAEYEAGNRFQEAYLRYVLKVKTIDNLGTYGGHEMQVLSAINGSRILKEAFEVLSPKQRELVIAVCVEDARAGTTRRVKYLKQALQLLAKQWKLL